jgi:LVIVD repeat-containing protein
MLLVVAPPAAAQQTAGGPFAGVFATRGAPAPGPVPRADCGRGSRPEGDLQGRVPAGSDEGFICNLTLLGRAGETGGFKVERYVDRAGHECAYYDTALVFPTNAPYLAAQTPGTTVLDMSDPAMPKVTATLVTPAFQSPHESVLVNQRRGLLAAVMGNLATAPGIVDLYDVSKDCRRPELLSSTPTGFLGHESGFAPDGNTFWATSLFSGTITAIDVSDPRVPVTLWTGDYSSHGMSLSADGNRAYLAELNGGLTILDVSEIQARKADPQARVVSRLTWPELSIPQNHEPVTIGGKPYLVETDEFAVSEPPIPEADGPVVGAARIISIADETAPKVVSNIRLAVHEPEHRQEISDDPGTSNPGQGYAAHYCGVPRRRDPRIAACSMIASGLRVFDIRNPRKPREIAYFVAPAKPSTVSPEGANYAMSRPTFDLAHREVWYSDGGTGFYALRLAKRVWPFGRSPGCRARQAFTIKLPERFRSARVTLDRRPLKVRRAGGRLRVRIDLRGGRGATHVLRIVARARNGERVKQVRRYRTCKRA